MFLYNYFNPHFRKGSDFYKCSVKPCFVISIHTSAREVTDLVGDILPILTISIHTSAREVTPPPSIAR